MSLQNVVIIGARGGFGTLLAKLLADAAYTVSGIDIQADSTNMGKFSRYVSSDIMNISPEAVALIQQSECVILSLPEAVTLACLPEIVELLLPDSLLLDLLSVKSGIVARMKEVKKRVELLSLHPMFAPNVGFHGQNVVAIEVRSGPRSAEFLSFIKTCGANVTHMTAEQHDASTAAIQVATHAAIISFGLALSHMDYNIEKALQIATPPHRILLALVARILAGAPETYWDIQLKHPLAASTRAELMQSLAQLDGVVRQRDLAEFGALLAAGRSALTPELENLAHYCAKLFSQPM